MSSKFLTGDNISLRPLKLDDATEEYTNWLNDTETCLGNSHHVYPNTIEATKKFILNSISDKNNIHLAVITTESENKHIGNVSLININYINRSAELAILIGDKTYWGKGVGFEAAQLIITHGFNNINLNSIKCGTFSNNKGMQSLALKLGMKKAGTLRQAAFKESNYLDIIQYDILLTEFKNK